MCKHDIRLRRQKSDQNHPLGQLVTADGLIGHILKSILMCHSSTEISTADMCHSSVKQTLHVLCCAVIRSKTLLSCVAAPRSAGRQVVPSVNSRRVIVPPAATWQSDQRPVSGYGGRQLWGRVPRKVTSHLTGRNNIRARAHRTAAYANTNLTE
jgi:hypothetical protein